jgi:hypothetical protein
MEDLNKKAMSCSNCGFVTQQNIRWTHGRSVQFARFLRMSCKETEGGQCGLRSHEEVFKLSLGGSCSAIYSWVAYILRSADGSHFTTLVRDGKQLFFYDPLKSEIELRRETALHEELMLQSVTWAAYERIS